MSNQLTPREHGDIRDLLLAGSQKIKLRVARRTLIPAAVATILVAGVVGTVVATTLGGDVARIASTPQPSISLAVPQPCLDYENSELEDSPGGAAITDAAAAADLGAQAVLSPGIQVRESPEAPGMYEADAGVCGEELNDEQLVAAATAIAKAIYADPAHAKLIMLRVSAWTPISNEAIAGDPNRAAISTAYQSHDWNAPIDTLVTAWE